MPTVLPLLPSIPNYRRTVPLPGFSGPPDVGVEIVSTPRPYIFDVRWNSREGAWYFDMYEEDETPIELGVKIVLGAALRARSTHPFFLNGQLRAIDTAGTGAEATLDDLGTRVQLWYFTVLEVLALRKLETAS